MLSWASRGSYGLLCTARPLLRPVGRTFATTPIRERSASELKKKVKRDAAKGKVNSFQSAGRTKRQNVSNQDFVSIVELALKDIKKKLKPSDPRLERWEKFERFVVNACRMDDKATGAKSGPLKQKKVELSRIYLSRGMAGVRQELEYSLNAEDVTARYSQPFLEQQKKVADLRYPAEWFGPARSMQRTIHLHVGPTNSGKTYHALKRLEESKNGFYAGPLRLLAQEVFARFKATGISCSLITGDDVQIPEGEKPTIVSNTVEMANLGQVYDVGVIDEIQMIADRKRGWAWTRAVLGTRAAELHLCGEARAVPLIRELAALTGDNLEIHRYERLNPLRPMNKSLNNDLKNLQKGDCLVSFSRFAIHSLKNDIEKATGRRAAIVYGGLPSEIRTQQASLFNDPDNDYDYLVASDAIGMGLNLSCKRIIFQTLIKRVPGGLHQLTFSEIKQIAGRAGRYRSAAQTESKGDNTRAAEENVGYVSCLEDVDLPKIREALTKEPPPITAAGILPPESAVTKFSAYFPSSVPFQYIIKRLIEVSQVSPLFFMCDPDGQLENCQIIDSVKGLTIEDRLTLIAAPLFLRDDQGRMAARAFATCMAEHTNGRLLDLPELNLEVLEQPVSGSKEYLHELEALHKSVILYSWLSFRVGGVFTDRTLAAHVKELVEERMIRALTEFSANKKLRRDSSLRRQIALQKQIQEQKEMVTESDIDSSASGATDDDGSDHVSERVPDVASEEASDDVSDDVSDENTPDDAWTEAAAQENDLKRPVPKEGGAVQE